MGVMIGILVVICYDGDSDVVTTMIISILIGNIEHAVVVHGCGLDEISPLGASTIFEIKNTAGDSDNITMPS